MKRILVYFVFLLGTVLSHAQGLGDAMTIDGITGIIFYLDETGEHGLILSPPAIDPQIMDKHLKKTSKKLSLSEVAMEEINKAMSENKLNMYVSSKNISNKERKIIYKDLMQSLGDKGEDNSIIIADYCSEKGLSQKEYFPYQYWALQLGNGWFIPGDRELKLLADFIAGGLGNKNGFKNKQQRINELSSDSNCQFLLRTICTLGLQSSSIKNANCGFRALRAEYMKITGKTYFDIFDEWEGKTNICAVHTF